MTEQKPITQRLEEIVEDANLRLDDLLLNLELYIFMREIEISRNINIRRYTTPGHPW